jgi:putative sigma-54 modulation protein
MCYPGFLHEGMGYARPDKIFSAMNISIQSIHFDADQKLINFIEKKLEKLDTFHDKILSAEVFLKLQNDDERGNKIVNVKLKLPGSEVFVQEQSATFEEATDNGYEILKRQLNKKKEKLQSR